jgi:uncharacterized protein
MKPSKHRSNKARMYRFAPPVLILCCILIASSAAVAQNIDAATPSAPISNGISVRGHAEIDAKPDVAYATLGVVTQAAIQADAVTQNATKSQAVRDALLKGGVADADIQTQYYQIEPQYDYRSSPAVLVGYQVTNEVKVTIHNLEKAGVIVDHATQAGANQVDGVTYDLSDHSLVEGQALAAAVANARSKADLMAGAAGIMVGRLVNLAEVSSQNPGPVYPMMMRAAAEPSSQATTPLAPQDIDITADVTAFYTIGYGK